MRQLHGVSLTSPTSLVLVRLTGFVILHIVCIGVRSLIFSALCSCLVIWIFEKKNAGLIRAAAVVPCLNPLPPH